MKPSDADGCSGSGQPAELLGDFTARCTGCGFVFDTVMDEPVVAPHLPPDEDGWVYFIPPGNGP